MIIFDRIRRRKIGKMKVFTSFENRIIKIIDSFTMFGYFFFYILFFGRYEKSYIRDF